MRRLFASAAVLIVIGGAVAFVLDRSASVASDPSTWSLMGGPVQGWSLRAPSSWHITQLSEGESGRCATLGFQDGVIVSSVDFTFHDPTGGSDCYGRFVLAGFPRTGVGLVLQPTGIRIGLFAPPESTRFPITYDELIHTDAIRGGPVRVSFEDVVIEGDLVYQVRLWIGRNASAQDRAGIAAVLGSIRFLHGAIESGDRER
ncbi:MAG: hypothetical protein M3P43_14920 [Actinomycetota bacterium]|nr:hypothetical protein [Actinomycetota bacterium]